MQSEQASPPPIGNKNGAFRRYVGRVLMTGALHGTGVAPWLADWSSTHVFSELWPPHARFHAVGYIVMASTLSIVGLWALWRRSTDPLLGSVVGAAVPIAYWGAFYVALLVPGTGVEDPGHTLTRIVGIPVNIVAATGQVLAAAVGFALHRLLSARPAA